MGRAAHTERNKTILKLRTEDGLTYQAIADMFSVSKQYIQQVVSGYDQSPAEKHADEYDVWEIAELTGFTRQWIQRNWKKENFPQPTRIVRRDSAYHYWDKDLILKMQSVYPEAKIVGHNEYSKKDCPSFDVQKWIEENPL